MTQTRCFTFWGSHGCQLRPFHSGQHVCDCCDVTDSEHLRAHWQAHEDSYGIDGCAGTWPYYGAKVMEDPGMSLHFFAWELGDLEGEFDRLRLEPKGILDGLAK